MRAGWQVGRLAIVALLVAGCSDLSGDSDTPIVIEIRSPAAPAGGSAPIEIGDTVTLGAVALNQSGDSVAATFQWRTPDTAFLFVDPATGRISGKKEGTARVQVRTGSLTSDLGAFAVVPFAESLTVVPPDSARVLVTDPASAFLVVELDTINPTGPLSGRQVVYTLTTIFGAAGDSASLTGGAMSRTVSTGATGRPTTNVYVRVIPGVNRPDSVLVDVSAYRPSSFSAPAPVPIPGSGQQFIVRFD